MVEGSMAIPAVNALNLEIKMPQWGYPMPCWGCSDLQGFGFWIQARPQTLVAKARDSPTKFWCIRTCRYVWLLVD